VTELVVTMRGVGISERQTQVMKAQAVQLVDVIRTITDALQLTAEHRALLPAAVKGGLGRLQFLSERAE